MSYGSNILNSLPYIGEGISRSVTPENPTGEKGKACMATEGTGARLAKHLGQGWKISPSIIIPAGQTAVLADIQAQGEICSMWIGGHITREYILRIYWDGDTVPAVECPLTDFFANAWLDNPARQNFAGIDVPVVGCTHDYLTHLYGDYMKFPAPWKRASRHFERF